MAGIHFLNTWWQKFTKNLLFRRLITVLSLDILVKASAVILLPIYLRLMTQEEYGVFNYILSIVYAFSVVMNLGLYIPQSKLYHDYDPAKKGKLLFNINLLLLLSLLLIVLPVYWLRLDYRAVEFLFKNAINYDRYRLWILLMTVTALFAFMLTNYFYTSESIHLIRQYSLSRIIGVNILSILALYLFKNKDAIEIRLVVNSSVELILLLVFYGFYIKPMIPVFNSSLLLKSLRLGLPIMLSAIFGIVINFGDKFFLEKHVDYKKLSVYYLAFSCASIISLLSNSLQNVWLPIFFKEKDLEKNIAKTNKMIVRLVFILIGLSVLAMIAVAVCLWWQIIPSNYHEVIYVLPLLLAGQVIVCVALLYGNYLVYFEKTSLVLLAGFFVSGVSITLNMILIPAWKIYGAAATLLVANACYLVIYYFIIRHYRKKHINLAGDKQLFA